MTVAYYQCQKCMKKKIVKDETKKPSCCGIPMKKITANICLQPDHAEHARPMDTDEPCDDFRGGI
jgi:hypothetical protein